MSIPADIQALADKARAFQAKVDACEQSGGHNYTVHGFSRIAHPETQFQANPSVKSLSDVKFSSYFCTGCGNRVTVEEGRAYMAAKYKREEAEREIDRLRNRYGHY